MSVPIVVDMNLSVEWITFLEQSGWPAAHWSAVGDPVADDATIMAWALARGRIVFTRDLDFGTALALSANATRLARTYRAVDPVGPETVRGRTSRGRIDRDR